MFLARKPPVGQDLLDHEVSTSHTMSQRPLPDNTQHSQHRKTSMPPVGFEPTISAGEWPQTYALDRAATGIGSVHCTDL